MVPYVYRKLTCVAGVALPEAAQQVRKQQPGEEGRAMPQARGSQGNRVGPRSPGLEPAGVLG